MAIFYNENFRYLDQALYLQIQQAMLQQSVQG